MKEKPIIFSTEMVRAILDGRKTQTRRPIKPQPRCKKINFEYGRCVEYSMRGSCWNEVAYHKPKYRVGDILWVRETFYIYEPYGDVYYRANYKDNNCFVISTKWKPSIHMPRAAARIFLRVTDVRVERLRDITPYDACCEGALVELPPCLQQEKQFPEGFDKWSEHQKHKFIESHARADYIAQCLVMEKLVAEFKKIWIGIYETKGYGWEANPWVWVYEFERVVDYERT